METMGRNRGSMIEIKKEERILFAGDSITDGGRSFMRRRAVPWNRFETAGEKEFRREEIKRFQECIRQLAEKYQAVYVPLQDLFDEALKKVETEYLLWDGVHPTVAGHGMIARQWYHCVEQSFV